MPEIIVTLGDSVINRYSFQKDVMTIGRSRDNDVVVANLAVSRNHAQIRYKDGDFLLSDLNSTNGTYVNGLRVTKAELKNGDVITIGKHVLLFKNLAPGSGAVGDPIVDDLHAIVVEREPVGYLIITRGRQKDMEFRIDRPEMTIGRGAECDVCLHDWFTSKQHASVLRRGNQFVLRDAGSWRGTKVNDAAVTEVTLKNGDEIQVGSTRLVFRIAADQKLKTVNRPPTPPPDHVNEAAATPRPDRLPAGVVEHEALILDESFDESVNESIDELLGESDEERPIRAGGIDDFIEPSPKPVEVSVAAKAEAESDLLFPELEAELRRSAEVISDAVRFRRPGEARIIESREDREEPESDERIGEIERALNRYHKPKGEGAVVETIEPPPARVPTPQPVEPLFGGGTDSIDLGEDPSEPVEPHSTPAEEPSVEVAIAPAPEPEPPVSRHATPIEAVIPNEPSPDSSSISDRQLEEIHMWERSLQNKSPLIRKLAVKMLKKLTGKEYD